jgi:hypothetical protein
MDQFKGGGSQPPNDIVDIIIRLTRRDSFDAFYNGVKLCHSRSPALSAARKLKALGFDDKTVITMKHEGSSIISLTTTVGAAARLRVYEPDNGPIRLREYRPHDRQKGGQGIPLVVSPEHEQLA